MPLSSLARAYARLASGEQDDSDFAPAFAQLSEAMTTHPDMVSGTARSDLAFMQAGRGDWVTKVGADGVQAFASKSRGEGFAIKISDANKPGAVRRHGGGCWTSWAGWTTPSACNWPSGAPSRC